MHDEQINQRNTEMLSGTRTWSQHTRAVYRIKLGGAPAGEEAVGVVHLQRGPPQATTSLLLNSRHAVGEPVGGTSGRYQWEKK